MGSKAPCLHPCFLRDLACPELLGGRSQVVPPLDQIRLDRDGVPKCVEGLDLQSSDKAISSSKGREWKRDSSNIVIRQFSSHEHRPDVVIRQPIVGLLCRHLPVRHQLPRADSFEQRCVVAISLI